MAPSRSVADSTPPSTTSEVVENDFQPFFVLHKASSRRKDRKPTAQGKLWKRNELSSSFPQGAKKLGGRMTEECDHHLFQQLQIEAFDIVWAKIESTIKDVLRDLNAIVFNDIQKWVLECFNATKLLGEPTIAEATRSFPTLNNTTPGQMFTAFVSTRNIEFVDDILTFEELGHFLKSHGCHVAKLSSLEFSSKNGIAGCLKALLQEFLGCAIDSADISILASWYREQVNYNKPLLLIVNDLERCCGSVLTDFILMLSEWVVKVPIIFIFGVATTVDASRNILPSHALERLCPSRFMLGTPVERMDAIVEAVLLKHCTTFSIGYKVAVFLRNYFINQDGTVTSFIRALKVACLLHFSMEPLSVIHGQTLTEDQKEGKSALSPETLLKYIDELPLCARNQTVDHLTQKSMSEGLSELVTVQKLWSTAVLCLYEAGKYSRVRLLDLFCEALSQDLYLSRVSDCHVGDEKDRDLSSTNDPRQQYSIMKSGGIIGKIVCKVRDIPTGMLYQLIESWEKLTADVSEIHEKLKILQSSVRCEDGKSSRKSSKDNSKRYPVNIDKDARMLNLQAIAFLDYLLKNFLKPVEGMPFHEIFCFKNVEKLQLVLIGDPRRRIQVDLLEFHKILRCSCCSKSGNALLPSRHDSSIMYSLAQEHGDLINLHDWFQSFRTIVIQHKNKRKQNSKQSPSSKKRKDINGSADQNEASIQARFCRAVTELQITGLVRMPSKRRPDFAQRVAFGL
ncbi:origin of replication complex subunit 3 [Glycine soja]|uniref:Origin of replication complex subunit 3 n=1 Tax=Glycine soja TaxID=3848 RepID=A0A445HJJ0_GLYSO|nr:origin of replication complex subunit 3 [Glycine soja]XP_028192997.1 origin of replication complex subunit 3 [Glycine soja]RZB73744.1 Origin of replication complex subunit 3 [Glycine soja]